ncbi:PQQ-dependent sugar dehydrogenase [Mycolicibacterium parafortuitum]|uniref:PKD domain-containing protein [Stackebrandtia nassauensis DSM] n=1 Tax=Mycolicibacterium parafortuitum TaxID=39692 RepID=A0A375YG21_MYCPF|nr:PQQ-dependent sugar dehydrogenase [Mycolicibacterium parafortuitum]ORB28835.1 glucose dehydrogenase [Mycolicibacterium parafortuitum]SRX80058.1 PKD domain-containing protein [Stackebrandtia nassauensis DSM] [Mycolicibacterium parafortuitum]
MGVTPEGSGNGRPPSGYARHVGRVGGLAFALGVGAALLTGTAVASAETSESSSASASASAAGNPASDSSTQRQSAKPRLGSRTTAERPDRSDSEDADSRDSDADAGEADDGTSTRNSKQDSDTEPQTAVPDDEADDTVVDARVDTEAVQEAAADEPSFFERLFDNKTPTITHDAAEDTVIEGTVVGNLNPQDPDSTRLTYTATRPSHGTVSLADDGTFVYTPGTTYTGQDSFQVTVSDARDGFHIHGAAGLLNLFTFGLLGSSGHRSTQSVFIGSERATVVSGLNSPVDFRFLPDGRILVAEKNGAIRVVENGTLRTDPLITLAVRTETERGIGGLAVDPDFTTNGRLYVAYVAADTTRNTLSRLVVDGNTATLDQILVQSTLSAAPNHHGGALGFGPDGALYWGVGDNATGSNAQNLDNIHGKILRLNTDGSVPDDNPVIGGERTLIYAYGLRNPFRLTFTPTGELLVADVGNAAFEEVNKVTAGGNYGWPGAEGLCTTNCADKIDPIYTYPREGGAAITSVAVHRDKVFIADTVKGWIRTLTCTPGYTSCGDVTTFDPNAGATVVLAEGPDGTLYQLVYQPGRLVRIDLADPSDRTRV